MLIAVGLILIGLIALVVGGEILVRGATRLAAIAGISPLVIGLTVVSFGTSAPELAVSLQACFSGQTDIAVGNIVGSNIFNVLFTLGISAMVVPLVVSSQLIRLDVPVMIGVSLLMLLMGLDGSLDRLDGCLLFGGLLVYNTWIVRKSRQETAAVKREFEEDIEHDIGGQVEDAPNTPASKLVLVMLAIIGGLVLLTFGARWLVEGSSTVARALGMSDLLIGLTVVAVGTSLPEVMTSVMACLKGEREIAVGNVVGSNIMNIMCVLGLSAVVAPAGISVSAEALRFDIPVMVAVAGACLPIFFTGHLIARWEGALFFAYYLAYTTHLVLAATLPTLSQSFTVMMLSFAVPLTAITLLVGAYRSLCANRRAAADR